MNNPVFTVEGGTLYILGSRYYKLLVSGIEMNNLLPISVIESNHMGLVSLLLDSTHSNLDETAPLSW